MHARVWRLGSGGGDLLVFPAASNPSMSRRISRDPKILPMILETEPPIAVVIVVVAVVAAVVEVAS